MGKNSPQEGDEIEVCTGHRFRGETGKIIAVGDNPAGKVNHYHVYFDRPVCGAIQRREIWLGLGDFSITGKAAPKES